MLALAREHAEIEPQLARAWSEALASMRLLKGPHLEAFEAEIAAYTGAARAVGVASGTDALALSPAAHHGPHAEPVAHAHQDRRRRPIE